VLSPSHIPELNIGSATCNLRFFTARVLAADNSRQRVVEVEFKPEGYYPDAGPAELLIHTDCKGQPLLRIPLDVIASGSLSASKAEERGGVKRL
jgi:hypothetical protein